MKLLLSYGTRPEFIKIQPLIEELGDKVDFRILFTGQHIDLCSFPHDFKVDIQEGSNRLDDIVAAQFNLDPSIFKGVTHTLVQGDTASAFSLALASFHRKIPVIHLEAGLRTYDIENPYPEEVYRQCISRIATLHLCPTEVNAEALRQERVGGKIEVVGNTVLDNLKDLKIEYRNQVAVTMHRRENHVIMHEWFKEINDLAKMYPGFQFILPIHPNPSVLKHRHLLTDITVIEPMNYEKFIGLLSQVRFIITDSGGIQEEASFLRKKCIVCRKTTERAEGLGTFAELCKEPSHLKKMFVEMSEDYIPSKNVLCPYGDGNSAIRIRRLLQGMR